MKLTTEQKAHLIKELSSPWGVVVLNCDGDRITLSVQEEKPLKFVVVVYVNGWFKGEWMLADKPVHEQRYMRKAVRPLWSASYKAKMEKAWGKRYVKKHYSGTMTLFYSTWSSGKAAIAHLVKVCESIEILAENGLDELVVDRSQEEIYPDAEFQVAAALPVDEVNMSIDTVVKLEA